MRLGGGQLVVEMLKAYGVRHVFGVPGDTGLSLYDALAQAQEEGSIRHIMARDERGAAYMADVYARVSSRPGVCEGPSGAGATYLASGLGEAHASSIPVVALTSDTPVGQEGRNVLTEIDQPALFSAVTKWTARVKEPGRIPDLMRRAFRVATSGRPGAVHLALPMDVLAEEVEAPSLHSEDACRNYPAYRTRPDPEAVKMAADLLLRAERPFIVAGGGVLVSGAWAELTQVAEKLGATVGTSINGKGSIAEDHPLSAGAVGSNGRRPYANELLQAADLILYVGCKTGSVTTFGWSVPHPASGKTIVHVDVDPAEIGRNYPTAVGLVGDAKLALADLAKELARRGVTPRRSALADIGDQVAEFWRHFEARAASSSTPIKPQLVIRALARHLPDDSIVVADAGTPTPFCVAYLRTAAGRRTIIPRGYGGLGYAIPGVVGAKLAKPEATVVGLVGDGSFGMSAGEMETIARLELPVTLIHFNNGCFGWIKVSQELLYAGRSFGVDFGAGVDHAAIAHGFGLQARRVENPTKLEPALREALASGLPTFLDVATDDESGELPPVEKFHRMSGSAAG